MWMFWIAIIIFLSFIEAATVNLVSIWFIASALLSLILSFFPVSELWQFGAFVVVGVILMITTKPMLQKWITPKKVKTNIDRVIGMQGVVTEEIKKNTIGEVRVDGKRWSAISPQKLEVGDTVIIDEIDGVKLKVHKQKVE